MQFDNKGYNVSVVLFIHKWSKIEIKLSVRKKPEEKPIIMINQGKSIFKQCLITDKQRNLPDCSCSINPKEDDHGIMISAFVSKDFGYGFDLTPEQLGQVVNAFRKGKHI